MKNIIQLAIIILALAVTSCAGMKKSTGHSKEEVMKTDAYAQAQVECQKEYHKMLHEENKSDIKLNNEYKKLQEKETLLKQKFFKKYQMPEEDLVKFQSFVKDSYSDLSVCKKVTEMKEANAAKEKEEKKKK